jgi:hypothetical protein
VYATFSYVSAVIYHEMTSNWTARVRFVAGIFRGLLVTVPVPSYPHIQWTLLRGIKQPEHEIAYLSLVTEFENVPVP